MSFGQRLKTAREKRGLTQEQLGEIIQVSRIGINHWERGRRPGSMTSIVALAKALKCSTDYLLGMSSKMEGT